MTPEYKDSYVEDLRHYKSFLCSQNQDVTDLKVSLERLMNNESDASIFCRYLFCLGAYATNNVDSSMEQTFKDAFDLFCLMKIVYHATKPEAKAVSD